MTAVAAESVLFEALDENRIRQALGHGSGLDAPALTSALNKAVQLEGLSLSEAAGLLCTSDPGLHREICSAAAQVKRAVYGDRIVFFAPLYVSNTCQNDCTYCGFRRSNTAAKRTRLTPEQVKEQIQALERLGHKRVLLVFGEGPADTPEYIVSAVEATYSVRDGRGAIRRVNVNCAPLTVDGFRKLKEAGIGTYQVFQETYHRTTYAQVHPSGPKSNYEWRVLAPDRAMQAGLDDIGMGVLYGLYDYRYDTLALLAHAAYLDRRYGAGPHTLSVPRIEPAEGAPLAQAVPYPVDDETFKRIVAVLRLAVPYTGIILSTRESPQLRDELIRLGVSQISAGSKTSPGGYLADEGKATPQFQVGDHRSLDEMISSLCGVGFTPSFCTACYRAGRTGPDFMYLAKPGFIQNFCSPNAILTFKEYLLDYASPKVRVAGEKLIAERLAELPTEALRRRVQDMLKRLEAGERDLYL
ncbi:MAG: [FeFe] hydrogenase H-cluster radical SAM maturase HydG [Armatimonadota bacterium]